MQNTPNKIAVYHYPQVPCKPFKVEVKNEEEAYLLTTVLADQHNWLFENNFIPDFSNSIQVMMYEDPDGEGKFEWVNYYNHDEGMDWDEIVETYFTTKPN